MLTAIVTTGLVCLVAEKLFKIELSFFFFAISFCSWGAWHAAIHRVAKSQTRLSD